MATGGGKQPAFRTACAQRTVRPLKGFFKPMLWSANIAWCFSRQHRSYYCIFLAVVSPSCLECSTKQWGPLGGPLPIFLFQDPEPPSP